MLSIRTQVYYADAEEPTKTEEEIVKNEEVEDDGDFIKIEDLIEDREFPSKSVVEELPPKSVKKTEYAKTAKPLLKLPGVDSSVEHNCEIRLHGNTFFGVHKHLLVRKSPYLKSLIKDFETKEGVQQNKMLVIDMDYSNLATMEKFLLFFYKKSTEKFEDFVEKLFIGCSDIKATKQKLLELAYHFDLDGFVESLSKSFFESEFTETNVCHRMYIANEIKDVSAQHRAFEFLMKQSEEDRKKIFDSDEFKELVLENPKIGRKIFGLFNVYSKLKIAVKDIFVPYLFCVAFLVFMIHWVL